MVRYDLALNQGISNRVEIQKMKKDILIIHRTTSFCPDCQVVHPARYEQRENEIYFIVDCPQKQFIRLISRDAELFKKFSARANYHIDDPPEFPGYRHVNVLEITNDCNFQCRFCLSSSNTDGIKKYKSLDEIIEIGKTIRKQKGYAVTISGGEPTLHRQLPQIVRSLKSLGLTVNMASNGYLLGRNVELAGILKRNGLGSVQIQLDSINEATHLKHRNNTCIKEKIDALRNCIQAGLRVVVVITVTRYNLNELGDLIRFCLQFIPHLYIISLQVYFPTGHTELEEERMVDREEIVKSIEAHPELSRILNSEFFRPLPIFRPMRMEVHPNCGVLSIILLEKGHIYPMDDLVDMPLFYSRLAKAKMKWLPIWIGYMALFYFLLTASHKGKRAKVLKAIYGYGRGKGDCSLLLITIEQFMHFRFQDEQRASRCATAIRAKEGIMQRGCWANRTSVFS